VSRDIETVEIVVGTIKKSVVADAVRDWPLTVVVGGDEVAQV
jgi:hypothetical protein